MIDYDKPDDDPIVAEVRALARNTLRNSTTTFA